MKESFRKKFTKHPQSLASKAKYIYDKDGEDNYWDHPDKIY
jgi:hypothetical protein